MPGGKRAHAFDDGEGVLNGSESQVGCQARHIQAARHKPAGQQGANFRSEEEQAGRRVVIEWLYTQPVACQKKPFLPRIPQRKSEHSGETTKARLAPLPVSLEEHFRVPGGAEAMAQFLEFAADLLEIVDFSVKDQPIACLRIMHRLVPGRREIKDGQASASQPDALAARRSEAEGSLSLHRQGRDEPVPACPGERSLTSGERLPIVRKFRT